MSTNRHSWRKLKAAAGRVPIARALYIGSLRRQVREHRKSAIVYVDGFNLYRNALQKHPEVKWLDLVRLCEIVMPGFTISKVRFFTAEIHALKGTDPRSPSRQQAYLRALDTNDRLVIHRGRFRAAKRTMDALPIEVGPDGRRKQVKVRKIEEKQSDVNLATWMIRDAMLNEADVYVLLSSDSDFAGLLNVMYRRPREVGGSHLAHRQPGRRTAASRPPVCAANPLRRTAKKPAAQDGQSRKVHLASAGCLGKKLGPRRNRGPATGRRSFRGYMTQASNRVGIFNLS